MTIRNRYTGQPSASKAALRLKFSCDLVFGLVLLVLTAPVVACAALTVWLEDFSNPFFGQWRAGWQGKRFRLWKLRTMAPDVPPPSALGQVASDCEHVTRVGRVLRRLKLDELPQLINVVKGDMSLVGPRPTLPAQADAYGHREAIRLLVRPGMTGWAQINGNTKLTWSDRIALDRWYVNNWSLALDIQILVRTIRVVVDGEQIVASAVEEARRC